MNKSVIQFLMMLMVANLGLGCTSDLGSAPKGNDIDVHDDIAGQTANIGLICPSYTLVFLVGSSEATSSVSEWNIAVPSRADIEKNVETAAAKFKTAIEKAKNDLAAAFARDPKCPSAFELIFASIIDGPGSLDSSIETMHFGMTTKAGTTAAVWKKNETKKWALADGKLVPKEAAFELNTAKDVGVITQILAKSSVQAITTSRILTAGGSIVPGQIYYILKTHGARIATDSKYQPTLENIKAFPRKELTKSEWQSAILMDTNGPSARATSTVFSAQWNPADINAIIAAQTAGETDIDTAGDGITDRYTSADGQIDTAGEIGATSGSKALSFQESLTANTDHDFLGKRVLGSFVTYAGNSGSIGEEAKIQFPVGNESNGGKNLVILDSCYASEQILNALEYDNGVRGKTVVLASVNELYFEFFDYSKLDLAGFLKMPILLERLKNSNNLTAGEKELLANMSKGTLDWQNSNANSAFKELAIWND